MRAPKSIQTQAAFNPRMKRVVPGIKSSWIVLTKHNIILIMKIFRCGGAVFEAEKLTVKNDVYHKRCFSCKRCSRAMDSLLVSVAPDNEIYCKVVLKQIHEVILHFVNQQPF
jgi:hypothetical protein